MANPPSDFVFSTPVNGTVTLLRLSDAGKLDATITVPERNRIGGELITAIGVDAFRDNMTLTSIDLRQTQITVIESRAFLYARNLTTVFFSPTLEAIRDNAFSNTNIGELDFPSTFNFFGSYAFEDNKNLTKVDIYKITASTITFGVGAFANGGQLTAPNYTVYRRTADQGQYDPNFPNATFSNTCFLEGTLILTPSGYKPVESLKKGDLVRTLKGDKPIDSLITQTMYHDASAERNSNQLFSLNYPSVFQPLIVTGGHSTLVTPTPKELEAIQSIFKVPEPVDGFYRLPAYVDEKASVYEVSGDYKVYHIVIGSTFEGIFANGLLVESCVIY